MAMKKLLFFIILVMSFSDVFAESNIYFNDLLIENKIIFSNKYYGACQLIPTLSKDKLKYVLQDEENANLISIIDDTDKTNSKLDNIYSQLISKFKRSRLGLYEIYSVNQTFLGIAGFLNDSTKEDDYPKIHCYIFTEHQGKEIEEDVYAALIDYAFQISNTDKIIIDTLKSKHNKIIQSLGYFKNSTHAVQTGLKNNHVHYEITRTMRRQRGLFELSKIIEMDPDRFIPRLNHLATIDMERSRELWSDYFGKGVPLCTGGSATSLLSLKDLSMINLDSFSGYRTDNPTTTSISEDDMKRFLLEEQIIPREILNDVNVSFCLGSHEGIVRLGRCIYNQYNNDGIFFPQCAYGLIVHCLGTMKPTSYKIHLVEVDRKNGEKINLESLKTAIDKNPKAKTLILEMKTIAGGIYTEQEINKIIALCKNQGIFLIMDYTHVGMEFKSKKLFPDFIRLCFNQNYHDFALAYTGSKIYGLERARVGFAIFSKKNKIDNLSKSYDTELSCFLGEIPNLPYEAMKALFETPIERRLSYKSYNAEKLRYNMNLMLAYVEGLDSAMIDSDIKNEIKKELSPYYTKGIKGIRIVYKPLGGMHMKVDMSELKNKYFYNIQMFNSEIFTHAINKTYNIATLHSFDFMDPYGFTMRLSFIDRDHVHRGMRAITNFVQELSDEPDRNDFLPQAMEMLNESKARIESLNK